VTRHVTTNPPDGQPTRTKSMTPLSEVRRYYEQSDDELARRYVKGEKFLSRTYCEAALKHRYDLYPFVDPFVDFPSWSGRRVLEIGCGQGPDLFRFAAAGARTFGCDLTRKHCEISRRFVDTMEKTAHVSQASATDLPYAAESFDLVYSFGVLLLVENLDCAVAEIHRVLKPGGTVITMFYNRDSLHYYLKTLYYYGMVCDLERMLGHRRLIDWFTDGFGYPRTYHQSPASLRAAFSRFRIEQLVVRNLTADQVPLISLDAYPPDFWSWLASQLGFYLMLRARK
jgi:SAM-dependent methyltransferase